jgi:hypothetical protein
MLVLTLVGEYGVIFCCSLIACEFIYFAIESSVHKKKWGILILKKPFLRFDLSVLACSIIIYTIFRLINPSVYVGNIPGSFLNFDPIFKTMFGHIYSGTSFSVARSYSGEILDNYFSFNLELDVFFYSMVIFICSFLLTLQFLLTFKKISKPFVHLFILCLFCLIISLPIGLTRHYQLTCNEICAHLDSRISFFGASIIISIFLLTITSYLQNIIVKKLIIILISFLIGGLSVNSYLENWHVAQNMRLYVSSWERAKQLACSSDQLIIDDALIKKIDPNNSVSFHPNFPIKDYWITFIKNWKESHNCAK